MSGHRVLLGFFVGITLGALGIFFFSGFNYQGIDFITFITEKKQNLLYEVVWLSFRFNFFDLFGNPNLTQAELINDFMPPFIGWLFSGFISGSIIKNIKTSMLNSFFMIFILGIVWLIISIIVGANMTFIFLINYYNTYGGMITALVGTFTGSLIGCLLSGREK